jgi:hypothetical protein
MFAKDGCVVPNIRTQEYRVTLIAECGHPRLRKVELTVRAQSPEDAASYVLRGWNFPRTGLHSVTLLDAADANA